MSIIEELDVLLKKYNLTIYDAMKIYEMHQIKPIRVVKCHEDSEILWQYYCVGQNPCGCGSNCYHYEYDNIDDEIYGVCNVCEKDIYVVKKEYKEEKLKEGKWISKSLKF